MAQNSLCENPFPCVVAACRPPIPPLGCMFSFFLLGTGLARTGTNTGTEKKNFGNPRILTCSNASNLDHRQPAALDRRADPTQYVHTRIVLSGCVWGTLLSEKKKFLAHPHLFKCCVSACRLSGSEDRAQYEICASMRVWFGLGSRLSPQSPITPRAVRGGGAACPLAHALSDL